MITTQISPVVALVVAAGSGSRLGAAVPKALVELEGVTLLRRSVDAMFAGGAERVVVTIPDGYRALCEQAVASCSGPVELVPGGQRRQDSVAAGLAAFSALPEDAVVLIHDAARPLVPADVVRELVSVVRGGQRAAVPVVPVVDSIRRVTSAGSEVVDRADLRAVQTPQAFRLGVIRDAHRAVAERALDVTDDAAACEAVGVSVALTRGHRHAMKITEPADLMLARAIVRGDATRAGQDDPQPQPQQRKLSTGAAASQTPERSVPRATLQGDV